MGETPKITDPLKALEAARASFEDGEDFTIGVEEEFAILDPAGLDMTAGLRAHRRRHPHRAARGHGGGRADPVRGRGAHRPVRVVRRGCRGDGASARRRDRARPSGWATGSRRPAPTRSRAGRTRSVIDTPHYHLVESTLRYVAWRNNTFGIHVHTGIRGADRAIAVTSALRSVLPELLAASCSSPWLEGRQTLPAVDADADLHPLLPPLRDPRPLRRLGRVRPVRALPDRHALDPRAHRDLVERAAAPGLPDGRDPHLRRPAGVRPGGRRWPG